VTAVCIDASVALKWFLREEGSDTAYALLSAITGQRLRVVAPPQFRSEVANVLYQRSRTQRAELRIDSGMAFEAIALFGSFQVETVDTPELYTTAYQVAQTYGLRSLYDALYVAAARIAECDLWTADERLLTALGGRLSPVRALRDWA